MTGRVMRRSRRRKRGDQRHAASPAQGVAGGMPRFLARKSDQGQDSGVTAAVEGPAVRPQQEDIHGAAEREADRLAAAPGDPAGPAGPFGQVREQPSATPLGRLAAAAAAHHPDWGRPLDDAQRAAMEQRLGADFDAVRIHPDSALADGFGANALTWGTDIHFGTGHFQPGSTEGDRLLGHELTHVAQQHKGGAEGAQFDLGGSFASALGGFDIDMQRAAAATGAVGLRGTIEFTPDSIAPYSTRIGLVQTASTSKMQMSTADPADQSGEVDPWVGTNEADRDTIATTGNAGTDPGWFVDTKTAGYPPATEKDPFYQASWSTPGQTQIGHVRSPTNVQSTMLWDFPQANSDLDFDFETVAKGADNQVVYGALRWGFEIVAGAVQREYVFGVDGQSPEFDEALERFQGFYSHEPVVVYFDTNMDVAMPGEEAKLGDISQYMADYPDAMIELEGYADERGRRDDNADLAFRRGEAVRGMLVAAGVAADRIEVLIWPQKETAEFGARGAARRTPGNLRANRRVKIGFVRSQSTLPVGQ